MHEYEIFSKLLHERNLTAYQVYKATGVPQSTLSDWKKGRYRPNAEKLLKIANFLGVTVEYLLTGDEEKRDFVNNNPELTESYLFDYWQMRSSSSTSDLNVSIAILIGSGFDISTPAIFRRSTGSADEPLFRNSI